jgi:hypothetical protein
MPPRTLHAPLAVTLCALFLAALPLCAQVRPLTRLFTPGSSTSYRVRLRIRSELQGQRTEKIGAVTYAVPFTEAVELSLSWRTSLRVESVPAGGLAGIEETMDRFDAPATIGEPPADEQTAHLAEALRAALLGWAVSRTLHYREATTGNLTDLAADGAPPLDEPAPPLLTLWLLRALRPAAALPQRPFRFGDRWQEPRAIRLERWSDVSAVESGEWLEAAEGDSATARIHIVQQISGRLPAAPNAPDKTRKAGETDQPNKTDKPGALLPGGEVESEGRFHGESLSTVSLQDGGVLRATRSASRERTDILAAIAGLPERPRFRATLSVQVEIEGCDEASCVSPGRSRP